MPDDEQEVNCALGVCCGGDDGDKQARAIAHLIGRHVGHAPLTLESVARAVMASFDLAEKGTLQAFKDSVARLARGNPYV